MTICKSLIKAKEQLLQFSKNITHLETEILLSNTLKKPREWLLSHGDKKLTSLQITNYKLQISKRQKGVPLAYLTGEKEFYGRKFYVNRNVLIPRPETELMVDEVIRLTDHTKRVTYIDVGTGSGCRQLWSPSTDWSQGGPLVTEHWVAIYSNLYKRYGRSWGSLIAHDVLGEFMRALVRSLEYG